MNASLWNRRQVLSGIGLIGLASWNLDALACGAVPCGSPKRVRKNATCPEAREDLETLEEGVRLLRSNLDANDPLSWCFWANVHGMDLPVPLSMKDIWNTCDHDKYFLPWHRSYLLFFEQVIAKVTKKKAFALPYWDWYESQMWPKAFQSSSSPSPGNPLDDSTRVSFKGTSLGSDAFSHSNFCDFQSYLSDDPHSRIHEMVGGNMGRCGTAAQDPLFFAHHANVDRLWWAWRDMNAGNQDPTEERWKCKTFQFWDVDLKHIRSARVGDYLDRTALDYCYDSLAFTASRRPVPSLAEEESVLKEGPHSKRLPLIMAKSGPQLLTAAPLTYRMPTRGQSSKHGPAVELSAPAAATDFILRIAGFRPVSPQEGRGFAYEFFLNLPRKENGDAERQDFRIGEAGSFQASCGHDLDSIIEIRFGKLLDRQREIGYCTSGPWSISIIPVGHVPGAPTGAPVAQFDSIEVVATREPSTFCIPNKCDPQMGYEPSQG